MTKSIEKKSNFVSAKLLFSCSFLAALINFVASFWLANVYQPDSFGKFALIFSIANLLSGFLFFRADFLVLREKGMERYAYSLLVYSSIFILIINSAVSIIFLDLILGFIVILWSFFIALSSLITYVAISRDKNNVIAISRLANAISITIMQLLLSNFASEYGMIIGSAFGCGIVQIAVIFLFCKDIVKLNSLIKTLKILKINFKGQLWSTMSWVGDALLLAFMPFMLTTFYGFTLAGYYAFADRLIKSPVSVFASTFSPLYVKFLSECNDLDKLARDKLKYGLIYIFLLLFLSFASYYILPNLIIFLWGDKWAITASVVTFVFIYYLFYLYNISTVYFYHHFGIAKFYLLLQVSFYITVFIIMFNTKDGIEAIRFSLIFYSIIFLFNWFFQMYYLRNNATK